MRMDSILTLRTIVLWTFVLYLWPSFTHSKPLDDSLYKDAEIRKQILTAAERVLEQRLQERTLNTLPRQQGTLAQGLTRQKKQDEPSPFFGGDYAYDRWSRAKKAWLHADREQDEPSPMFPGERNWGHRLKKNLDHPNELPISTYDTQNTQKEETNTEEWQETRQLIDNLVTMWKLNHRPDVSIDKKSKSPVGEKVSVADILELLKSN